MTAPSYNDVPLPFDPDFADYVRQHLPRGVPDGLAVGAAWLSSAYRLGELQGYGLRPFSEQMPEALHDCLVSAGFCGWAAGQHRAVFIHESGWCLKVPVNEEAVWAQIKEMWILGNVRMEDLPRFAETYELPDHLLLQRTYVIAPDRCTYNIWMQVEISTLESRYGIRDLHAHNIGWTVEGEWVLTDWAGQPDPVRRSDDLNF